MEGDSEASGGGGHASSGNSRWNPTKEQISMLENLYNQGVRTPSAEQIQQITTRLRAFGIIEGKSVFYWFQNHKARQRQKQKQDSLASFNRFLHQPTPPFHVFPPYHPPSPNVVCSPYYVPQSEIGLYQQCPKVLLPSSINRRSSPRISGGGRYHETVCSSYGYDIGIHSAAENVITSSCSSSNQKTLALFPMHPTGILQGKSSGNSSSSISTAITTGNSNNAECSIGQTGFYDFFSTDQGSFVID